MGVRMSGAVQQRVGGPGVRPPARTGRRIDDAEVRKRAAAVGSGFVGAYGDSGLEGRSGELSTLDDLVGGLVRGVGRVLWIEGEPGIGKSSLVSELAARAAARGCAVSRGAAEELAQPFPLRTMARRLDVAAGSLDPLRVEIADLIGGRRSCGVLDPVLAAGERMLELVDRVCAPLAVLDRVPEPGGLRVGGLTKPLARISGVTFAVERGATGMTAPSTGGGRASQGAVTQPVSAPSAHV
ncbi:ATP-binding protein [Couchioplanes caeruleus]|uniref:ATP-binding protein n=1 Tax=Couchioplanes caeruleus TaxID=56438 RepID=UPI00147731F0|nr:ATP-binding protein [Couchioplanes caeruleus]